MNQLKFSRVRGKRCPRPLMTNTAARQGSDKSPEKSTGRCGSRQALTTDDVKHKATRNGRLCMHGCRCKYGTCSNGDQPQPPTISGAMCTCMDACVSTNGPAWSVNHFYLMVRRRGTKCVHQPQPMLPALCCGWCACCRRFKVFQVEREYNQVANALTSSVRGCKNWEGEAPPCALSFHHAICNLRWLLLRRRPDDFHH